MTIEENPNSEELFPQTKRHHDGMKNDNSEVE
jgi:hypothetical protein